MKPVQELLLCECASSEHQMIMRYFEDDLESTVYVDVHLVKKSFWERVKYAIKYIFGYKCKYGYWDCWMLQDKDAIRLRDMLNHYIELKGLDNE